MESKGKLLVCIAVLAVCLVLGEYIFFYARYSVLCGIFFYHNYDVVSRSEITPCIKVVPDSPAYVQKCFIF